MLLRRTISDPKSTNELNQYSKPELSKHLLVSTTLVSGTHSPFSDLALQMPAKSKVSRNTKYGIRLSHQHHIEIILTGPTVYGSRKFGKPRHTAQPYHHDEPNVLSWVPLHLYRRPRLQIRPRRNKHHVCKSSPFSRFPEFVL